MNMISIPRYNFNVTDLKFGCVNSEILRHAAYYCRGLKHLELYLKATEQDDFAIGLENLEELRLNGVKDASIPSVLEHIASLSNLLYLKIEWSHCEEESYDVNLPKFKKLKHLEHNLWKHYTYDTCQFRMSLFRACTADLTSIDVGEINDREMHVLLDNCPSLKSVCLRRCHHFNEIETHFITRQGMAAMFTKLGKSLETLRIKEGSYFSKDYIDLLVESDLSSLKILDLDIWNSTQNVIFGYNPAIVDDFIPVIKKYGKQLEFFKIIFDSGGNLTDELLLVSVKECPNLLGKGYWDISGAEALTEAGISKFVELCGVQLVGLYACGTHISDDNIKELSTHCPNLEELDLGLCKDLTVLSSDVLTFMVKEQSLRTVRIQGTELDGGETETALKTNCPDLYSVEGEEELQDYRRSMGRVCGWGQREKVNQDPFFRNEDEI